MDKRTKTLLGAGGFFGLVAFVIAMSTLLPAPQREAVNQAPKTLTEDEVRLPDEKPQHLIVNNGKTGTLVVNTNLTGGYVFIDQEAQVLPEGNGEIQGAPLYPPFRIENVAVGLHKLSAIREGSSRQDIDFEIKENEVTRIEITFSQRR